MQKIQILKMTEHGVRKSIEFVRSQVQFQQIWIIFEGGFMKRSQLVGPYQKELKFR
jgi:hypothetical protein